MFKTLEEAQEHYLKLKEKHDSLSTANEGLKLQYENEKKEFETKISDYENKLTETSTEIERLKIKNYELFERVTVSNTPIEVNNNIGGEKEKDNSPTIDDIIKDFKF